MKLALLTADCGNPAPNLGDWFITHSLERLLGGHQTFRVPLHTVPTGPLRARLFEADAWIICGSNLVGNQGTVRTALSPEDFETYSKPIHVLGMGSQADLQGKVSIDARGQRILRAWTRRAPLSARDPLTAQAVTHYLGAEKVRLVGCPSLTLKFTGLGSETDRETRTVFCPPPFHYRPAQVSREQVHRLVSALWRQLESPETLYLAQEPDDLTYRGINPSSRLLHAERSPSLHGEVLASAGEILSFRIHPCLVALGQGTRAFLLALDERTRGLAASLGIPHLIVDKTTTAITVTQFVTKARAQYPWPEIQRRVERIRSEVRSDLAQRGLWEPAIAPVAQKPLRVALLASGDFSGSVLAVLENLKRVHHGTIMADVLALDAEATRVLTPRLEGQAHRLWSTGAVWGNDSATLEKMRLPERAYASKPLFLRKILEHDPSPLVFIDADLFFFRSPATWIPQLEQNSVLLFPQHCDELGNNRLHGLYNAGLMGLGAGAKKFLEWWSARCLEKCVKDLRHGFYFEQGYLDLAPVEFKGVAIYQGRDENAATWNLRSLGVRLDPQEPWTVWVKGQKELGSFHASEMDALGVALTKFSLDVAVSWARGLSPANAVLWSEALAALRLHHPRVAHLCFARDTLRRYTGLPLTLSPARVTALTRGFSGWLLSQSYRWWGWGKALRRKVKRLVASTRFGYPSEHETIPSRPVTPGMVSPRSELEAVSSGAPDLVGRGAGPQDHPSVPTPL